MGADKETEVSGRPGSSSEFSTMAGADSSVALIHPLVPTTIQFVPKAHVFRIREEYTWSTIGAWLVGSFNAGL